MTLKDLGYTDELETYRSKAQLEHFNIGRVIAVHKERYVVKTPEGEYDAEIIGNLRYTATQRSDFPAVGDWVALSNYDEDKALIHAILPRKTLLERKASGKQSETQVIAANIDVALIIQATDRDFNLNRIERYLTLCYQAKVEPIILLTKIDLIVKTELIGLLNALNQRFEHIPVFAISNTTQKGINDLAKKIKKGKTYCLLGSSGVGKSTLLNNLGGKQLMETGTISEPSQRGKHITTHRELVVLDNGGILIDNPGMREVGMAVNGDGLETTFDKIMTMATDCKFKDCTHTSETGCAVLDALNEGRLDPETYENYLKLQKEQAFFDSSVAEKRRRDKSFGKMMKNYKKDRKRNEI